MDKLKVGIIGTGLAFSRLHYPAYQELSDKYEIVALCDPEPDKTRPWAERLGLSGGSVYTDYRPMLWRGDINVFDIMVPIEHNFRVTEDVARAIARQPGRAIICEKPLAANYEQARAHAELPSRYGVPIMIAENYRYSEEINIIRDLVRQKKVGEIVYFIYNRVVCFPEEMLKNQFAREEWRQHPVFAGGVIMDSGVHDVAALRHIFGGIDKLHAFGVPQRDDFAPYAVVTVNMYFKNGIIGNFSFYSAGKEMQRPLIGLRIFGTAGMIYLEESDCGTINVAYNDGRAEQIHYRPGRGYYNELLNLYNAMKGLETISVTPEIEYGDAKTILDILRSIKNGGVVAVDNTGDYIPHYRSFQQPAQFEYHQLKWH
ncbi:Gfo/Idh/MocA family protein [Desulfallas thermosapovorans]|uniref:Putative dehydrogenase n=1 Tax=Desulfallas thermosapovorans DSM 6562 TaxID=1121431 RepID=A0A5S4ZV84_9FIRM|nr:Gfo/Idh/MocA family oxidoreductase [Desulfallas thermosapovorans]TYO96141.1 putative dehydrogenase [Desulfallas thermosapovorans DSM 6562]